MNTSSSAQIRTARNFSSNVLALFDNAFLLRSECKFIKGALAWTNYIHARSLLVWGDEVVC